ncbi:MAG: hypothetical protein HY855_02200 [Burkholderiales bacterium]|nr:hypothetical protein [Burkholderiales bacterium]
MTQHANDVDATRIFVVRLSRVPGATGLHGRLEHVLTGRQHDFDSAEGLVDCLLSEERQLERERGDLTRNGGRPGP